MPGVAAVVPVRRRAAAALHHCGFGVSVVQWRCVVDRSGGVYEAAALLKQARGRRIRGRRGAGS